MEDTRTTPAELRSTFGDEIAALVAEMTDDKSLDKAERKRLQEVHASHLSSGARLIKLADKIANVRDVTNHPPADWSDTRRREYLDWTERVVAGIRGTNAGLEACYDAALAEGRARIG